jgi:hypothetical protein
MEINTSRLNSDGLKGYFKRLGFDSMINEKPWSKYIKTFEVINE